MTREPANPARKFNARAFVAMMAALTGASLPVSGLFNHLHQFEPLTTARHAWMAAHTAMAILFTVFAGWHIALNRRMLVNYLRKVPVRAPSREAVLAGVIVILVLFVAVGHAFLPGASHDNDAHQQRHLPAKG